MLSVNVRACVCGRVYVCVCVFLGSISGHSGSHNFNKASAQGRRVKDKGGSRMDGEEEPKRMQDVECGLCAIDKRQTKSIEAHKFV